MPTLQTQQQACGVMGASVHLCMSWGVVWCGLMCPLVLVDNGRAPVCVFVCVFVGVVGRTVALPEH